MRAPDELRLEPATPGDAPAIVTLRNAATAQLTATYGDGQWSRVVSEKGVLYAMRIATVFVARVGADVVATVRLGMRKPWAIDVSYFSTCARPLYLTDMAVSPGRQRSGIGRACMNEVRRIAREWPADAIRLDAYDADAGAGEFYRKCGMREVGRTSYRGTPLVYFEALL